MFHHFTINMFGQSIYFHTNTTMIELFALFAIVSFTLMFRKERLMGRAFALAIVCSFAALMGARIFHLVVEKPWSEFEIQQLFEFDGMTFYGSVILASLVAFFGARALFPKTAYPKILDLSALYFAFGYGFLRIGCFANGCCWGRLTAVSWAVRYDEGSEMPYIGLPVHPVQLYDAFVGLSITVLLLFLWRKPNWKGALMPVFLVLSSIGRFITEFFRGDSYRGTDVVFALSTSQTISVVLLVVGAVWLFLYFKRPTLVAGARV